MNTKLFLAMVAAGVFASSGEDEGGGGDHDVKGPHGAQENPRFDGSQDKLVPGSRHGGNGKARSDADGLHNAD
jgi:hypothetical protein